MILMDRIAIDVCEEWNGMVYLVFLLKRVVC